jgi:hypothetical protein
MARGERGALLVMVVLASNEKVIGFVFCDPLDLFY